MDKVYSDLEAMKWFLENHSGKVICVKDGKEKVVDNYGCANKFFREKNQEKIMNAPQAIHNSNDE